MPSKILDRLVVLWIMPPLGFFITLLQVPELRYLNSYPVLLAILLGAVALRLQLWVQSRRTILFLVVATILMVAFMSIEWIHFLAGRSTIDKLTDLRMIIYSSFYGSIIIFVLYAIYLTTLGKVQKKSHLVFVVKLMCWFHLLFIIYWVFLALHWIKPVPRADLLRSNSIAYEALFFLCVMLFYRSIIGLNKRAFFAFFMVNVAVILLNRTRGAIIVLVAGALCYFFIKTLSRRRQAMLVTFMLGTILCGGVLVLFVEGTLFTSVLGKDSNAIWIVLDKISDAYDNGQIHFSIGPEIAQDESTLSAFSRIGSNYYSLLSFMDNPLLGIGQAESYSIKIIGAGVHSLHFLMANSTGILGMLLFAAMLVAIISAQSLVVITKRLVIMFLIFFGYMIVFINSLPVYFALIPTLLSSQHIANRHVSNLLPESTISRIKW